MNWKLNIVFTTLLLLAFSSGFAKIWQVGPSRTYTKPSAVSTLVSNGDTVEIDTGLYSGDCTTWTKSNLLLRGKSQFAHLDANGLSAGGKAIWVISGNNVRVENIEFSGCQVADSNGAGIRIEGKGLYVYHCYFHHNENGMLGGSTGSVVVESSEFSYNGHGDGYSHNIYINHADSFTLKYCYMHHAKIGHEVKSRANRNYILYNRIMNESSGTASRDIDLPNGGLAIVMGNLIQQGPLTQNSNMLGYGLEGLTNTVAHQLYLINNTFVNQRGKSGIFISTNSSTALLKAYNNLFTGQPYTFLSGSATTIDTLSNLLIPDPAAAGLTDFSNYNYDLVSSSPCINKGTDAGSAGDFSLKPINQYKYPLSFISRYIDSKIDVGATEYNPGTKISENTNSVGSIKVLQIASENRIIILNNNSKSIGSVQIFDITGRQTDQFKNISKDQFEWNYSSIKKGIYLIRVTNENEMMVKKIIIK